MSSGPPWPPHVGREREEDAPDSAPDSAPGNALEPLVTPAGARKLAQAGKREEWRAKIAEAREAKRSQIRIATADGRVVKLNGTELTLQKGFKKSARTIDARTEARVDTGSALTGRATATRVIAGGLLGGGVGTMLGAGMKKGSIYLFIEGADWAELIAIRGSRTGEAHAFAQRVNLLARTAGAPDLTDDIGLLERLGRLRTDGVLTEDEFKTKKRELLGD